jgi:hypothetical protein
MAALAQRAAPCRVQARRRPPRRNIVRQSGFDQDDPQPFIECVQTIFSVEGTATPVTPGTVIEHEVPDMYGRPWARLWEQYWEAGMAPPQEEDIFSFE